VVNPAMLLLLEHNSSTAKMDGIRRGGVMKGCVRYGDCRVMAMGSEYR